MLPYVGITGITRREEVDFLLPFVPRGSPREFMIGVLASWKSLRGIPLSPEWWQKRFPDPHDIPTIFPRDKRVLNLVHYAAEDGHESWLLADMIKIHELAGPHLNGFQLNMPWPEIRLIDEYRTIYGYEYRLVLQIGERAAEEAGGTPKGVAEMLERCSYQVDAVLFDMSGGRGRPLDVRWARELYREVTSRGLDLGFGVAGNLGPDSLQRVEPLAEKISALNVDAERDLRNSENELDLERAAAYLVRGLQLSL